MNKGAKIAVGIWDVFYPLALYYAVTIILMFAAQLIFGTENENYMICEILASAITIPIMYQSFYKPDKVLRPFFTSLKVSSLEEKSKGASANRQEKVRNALCIVGISALIGIGLNNIILMSPLATMSGGYEEAASHFYGGTFVMELIGSAFLTPILEELVYRGIIYSRLKYMVGIIPSMVGASLIFAIMHFNIVQFLYAFLLGFVLIVFMEKTGHVYGAILGHITANTIAVVRTETGILAATVDKSAAAWSISAVCLILGVLGLLFYVRKNPEFMLKNG